jgi:hypothetical protein
MAVAHTSLLTPRLILLLLSPLLLHLRTSGIFIQYIIHLDRSRTRQLLQKRHAVLQHTTTCKTTEQCDNSTPLQAYPTSILMNTAFKYHLLPTWWSQRFLTSSTLSPNQVFQEDIHLQADRRPGTRRVTGYSKPRRPACWLGLMFT